VIFSVTAVVASVRINRELLELADASVVVLEVSLIAAIKTTGHRGIRSDL